MAASAGEAASAISSSLRIAPVIFSSRNLFGISMENRSSRLVLSPALFCRHSEMPRSARSTAATPSSSFMVRRPPACALRREFVTLERPPNDGDPNFAISTNASSVCRRRRAASCGDGVRASAAAAASGQDVSAASSFSTLSSSNALACFCISCCIKGTLSSARCIPSRVPSEPPSPPERARISRGCNPCRRPRRRTG